MSLLTEYLLNLQRAKTPVLLTLHAGKELKGCITRMDESALVLRGQSGEMMIPLHAIAAYTPDHTEEHK